MYATTVSGSQLELRLDPAFYHPSHLRDVDNIMRFPVERLDALRDNSARMSYGVLKPRFENNSPYRMVRIQDFRDPFLDVDSAVGINQSQFAEFHRSECRAGDILIAIAGYVGRAAIVPEFPLKLNINQHIARFRPSFTYNTNPYYLISYLISSICRRQLCRYVSGSVQTGINLEDLRELLIPQPDPLVQKYIGDKVRQAERLRSYASSLLDRARSMFDAAIGWRKGLEERTLFRRITSSELVDRLDLNFNSPSRFRVLEHFMSHKVMCAPLGTLADVSAMIGWKGLTTEHYTDKGPWLLRGVEYSNGVIDFDSLVSISREKYEEQPQIHLREGDVALTKDGTIGRALAIPVLSNEMAAGSTVARVRPKGNDPIDPYFLEFALNHPAMQIQIQGFATGMAQPHITQEWIVQLVIPSGEFEAAVSRLVREHHTYIRFATSLIDGAKALVEGLIDGTIEETEIEQAQQDLERQDRKADRSILSRITRKGIDTWDSFYLFPDVDAFYTAIDEISRIDGKGEAS